MKPFADILTRLAVIVSISPNLFSSFPPRRAQAVAKELELHVWRTGQKLLGPSKAVCEAPESGRHVGRTLREQQHNEGHTRALSPSAHPPQECFFCRYQFLIMDACQHIGTLTEGRRCARCPGAPWCGTSPGSALRSPHSDPQRQHRHLYLRGSSNRHSKRNRLDWFDGPLEAK